MMYWVQKFSLLRRTKRPIPGADMVNVAVGQIIGLGPIMLALGQLVFSDILSANDTRGYHYLVHFITVLVSVFFYLIPFKIIYRLIYSEDEYFEDFNYF
jgi:hypothetical protein